MPDTDDRPRVKECPVCYESMRLMTRQRIEHIPGVSQAVKLVVKNWECPECSYEEEDNEDQ